MDKMRVFIIISLAVLLDFAESFRTVEINANEGDNVTLSALYFPPTEDIQWVYRRRSREDHWIGFIGDHPNCRLVGQKRNWPYITRVVVAVNCTAIMLPNVTLEDTGRYTASDRSYGNPEKFYLTVYNSSEVESEDFGVYHESDQLYRQTVQDSSAATSLAWNWHIPELSLLSIGYYYMTHT